MKKTAIVLNWVMLGLFGLALVGTGVQYPGAVSGSSLILLLPYATAQLAFKSNPNRLLIGSSVFLNALMVLIGIAFGLIGLTQGEAAKTILVAVILLPAAILNCIALKHAWDGSRKVAKDSNQNLQTSTTAPPEA
jgi:hypothetical protein